MKANVREDISSISRMLFNKVSRPKQHAIIKFTGDTGLGKSYATLGCFEKVSFLMENYFGGNHEDYFNIDNVAIITQEEIRRVVKRFNKHGIYILDDFGVGDNARRAMSDDNILLNDIVSTFRPNENVLGMTVPKNRMIDVVQRELAHYSIEMNDPFFDKGYSTGTLYIPQEDVFGNIIYTYPIWNGKIYKRHIFSMPSKKLAEEYDERRNLISKELELDNVSMYGLKSETKKMKSILAARKVGIQVDNPRMNKFTNDTDIIIKKDSNDNRNDNGNKNKIEDELDLTEILKNKKKHILS